MEEAQKLVFVVDTSLDLGEGVYVLIGAAAVPAASLSGSTRAASSADDANTAVVSEDDDDNDDGDDGDNFLPDLGF